MTLTPVRKQSEDGVKKEDVRGLSTNVFGVGLLRKTGTIEFFSVIASVAWRSARLP